MIFRGRPGPAFLDGAADVVIFGGRPDVAADVIVFRGRPGPGLLNGAGDVVVFRGRPGRREGSTAVEVMVFRGRPGGRRCGEAVVARLLLGGGAASSRQFQASLEIAKADVRASRRASRAMQAALWVSKMTFISGVTGSF